MTNAIPGPAKLHSIVIKEAAVVTPKMVTPAFVVPEHHEVFIASGKPVQISDKPKISVKKSSPPVTNPAFREHEGLRNLQRQLHVDANKTK